MGNLSDPVFLTSLGQLLPIDRTADRRLIPPATQQCPLSLVGELQKLFAVTRSGQVRVVGEARGDEPSAPRAPI